MYRHNEARFDNAPMRIPSLVTFLLLASLFVAGCNAPNPFTQAASTGSSATHGASTPQPAASALPSNSVATNVPMFVSATAIKAMQSWASEVKDRRIVDGSTVRSPTNSGWIESANNIQDFAPYGVSTAYTTSMDGPNENWPTRKVVSVVGAILYVFAYTGATDSSSPSKLYGLLLGTINGAGQPVTLLIWMSPDTAVLVGIPIAEWTSGHYIGAETYDFSSVASIASLIAQRFFLGRTITVRFVTSIGSSAAGQTVPSADEPQVIARNTAMVSQITKPTASENNTGVIAAVPTAGLTISPQEGAIAPDSIRLPLQPSHRMFSF